MTGALGCELALELLERLSFVTSREADETPQPVQGNGAKLRTSGCRAQAGGQLTLGFVEDLPGDVDRGRQPVGERKVGKEHQCPVRRTQSLFSPRHVRQAEVMAPAVGLETD